MLDPATLPPLSAAPNGRRIRCLLFDLGDTLWTMNQQIYRETETRLAVQRALTLLRQHLTPQQLAMLAEEELVAHLYSRFYAQISVLKKRDPDYEPELAQAVILACAELGLSGLSSELAAQIAEALRVRIPGSRNLFADALTTLKALRERGYLLGVVTNRIYGGSLFLEDMRSLGLLDYFDPAHIAISADLRIRKPAAGIFRFALDGLGVSPEETAMVGDSLLADVVGANRLGMFSIWMPTARLLSSARKELPATQFNSAGLLPLSALIAYNASFEHALSQHNSYLQPALVIERLGDLLQTFKGVTTS